RPVEPRIALTLVVVGAAGFFWMGYLRWKDRARPEPIWLMTAVAGGGVASLVVSLGWYATWDAVGVHADWDGLRTAPLPRAAALALLIGFVEEGAKMVPVVLIAMRNRRFDEILDGFIYAGCA